jgi:uncharacterized protein (TIGR00290 family)
MSWSSGKDSTMALDAIRADEQVQVVALMVTMNVVADRVAMHAVRRTLVETQAARLGLPLKVIEIPSPCSNEEYEARMSRVVRSALDDGVEHFVFGDLFLEDVRSYREEQLTGTGISAIFPLWGRSTAELAVSMIDSGVRAIVTCVDPVHLSASFAGRTFDERFLGDLPPRVDPCGERGEFHTFVSDGPGFSSGIDVAVGEIAERDGFVFCDLIARSD